MWEYLRYNHRIHIRLQLVLQKNCSISITFYFHIIHKSTKNKQDGHYMKCNFILRKYLQHFIIKYFFTTIFHFLLQLRTKVIGQNRTVLFLCLSLWAILQHFKYIDEKQKIKWGRRRKFSLTWLFCENVLSNKKCDDNLLTSFKWEKIFSHRFLNIQRQAKKWNKNFPPF